VFGWASDGVGTLSVIASQGATQNTLPEYEVAEKAEDYVVLRIRGDLTGDPEVDRLHEVLEEQYVDDGVKIIRVNMEEVGFLSLEGVAMVVDLLRESRERGKRFIVEGLQGQPLSKLAMTGVLRVLTSPDD
jgi:anti-anti-sigma factor